MNGSAPALVFRPSFALSKWYFDCVAEDGRTAIAYASVLRWRGLSVHWSSIDVRDGAAAVHRASTRRAAAPRRSDGSIQWRHSTLGCAVDCRSVQSPFARTLHRDTDGAVDWSCEASAARVRIEVADAVPVEGLGYAERLELSVLPWRLGIDELRWGRWIAGDGSHSIVWIDWRGAHPQTNVFVDGVRASDAKILDTTIAGDGVALSIDARQTVVNRSLGDVIGPIRRLVTLVPLSFLRAKETKWSGIGTASGLAGTAVSGSTLHEIVSFR